MKDAINEVLTALIVSTLGAVALVVTVWGGWRVATSILACP